MIEERAPAVVLDEENPWPALSAFEEAGQRFFNGRRDEAAALRRLVGQAALTVVFGKSGLGKTSLLQAGLFPLLRADRFLPVYVRIDFQRGGGPLIDQVAAAYGAAAAAHANDAPALAPGESLWRYLHRTDLEIWDAQNHLLTPVFVLDQFEEAFTLGADNAAAVSRFRVDLADLVENRIPASLAARSEEAEGADADLELQRQHYKVLVSFREDFLPAIEGWKQEMPSLLRNRLRLLPMTGTQAFEAVHDTAPRIAPRDIADEIVRFVAATQLWESAGSALPGGPPGTGPGLDAAGEPKPLRELVVEPALLSLVCHGLNERRKPRPSIDQALLRGTGRSIIEDFYQGSVKDLPDTVRRFIENELITERGFRKLCSIDDARSGYDLTDAQLRALVNRRLLRIEPSQGIERVELMHDVLTPVVRQERDRQREQQRRTEEKAEARRQRTRARTRVLTAAVVMLLIILAGIGGLARWALEQKQIAEASARTARARLMAAVGASRLELEPDVAMQLALKSLDVEATARGESLLRQSLMRTPTTLLAGHGPRIAVVALAAGGEIAATVAEDGSARIWDVRTGTVRHQVTAAHPIVAARFSPDGGLVAFADDQGSLTVWDGAAGTSRYAIPVPEIDRHRSIETTHLAFDPTGQSLAVVRVPGPIAIWKLGEPSLDILGEVAQGARVVSLWFSEEGRRLNAVAIDGRLRSWGLKDRPRRAGAARMAGSFRGTLRAVVPTQHMLVLVGNRNLGIRQNDEGFVYVVDPSTGALLRELKGCHAGQVLAAAGAPNGDTVISADTSGAICVWNTASGELQRVLHGPGPVRSLDIDGHGRSIISGGDDQVARVWPVAEMPSLLLKGHEGLGGAVTFAPDGRWLASGGQDRTVRIWNAADGSQIHKLEDHRDDVYTVAVSPDGRLLASAGGAILGGRAASRDLGAGDTAIRLWDPGNGRLLRRIDENRVDVFSASFTPDGCCLVTTGADAMARIWDVGSGRLTRTVKWAEQGSALSVALSQDGRYVAAACDDGIARVWEYKSGASVAGLGEPGGTLSWCAFDQSGTSLLTTSLKDADIKVWSVENGRLTRRFKGYEGANAADLSGAGTLAITAEISGAPKLWDVTSGVLLASLTPASSSWGVAFSRDARRIAASSLNGSIYLFDCAACGPIQDLRQRAEKRIAHRLTPDELRAILGE